VGQGRKKEGRGDRVGKKGENRKAKKFAWGTEGITDIRESKIAPRGWGVRKN